MSKEETTEGRLFGKGAETWLVDGNQVDMTVGGSTPLPLTLQTEKESIKFDVRQTALIVIDMQNDFCSEGGWADQSGFDLSPDRKPIGPIAKLLPVVRQAGIRVIWLNWGNRPDLLNLSPTQIYAFYKSGSKLGVGDPLPHKDAKVLLKDSWSSAVVDALEQRPDDIRVDKYRASGFWDTPLDSILRNLGIRTILFAGIHTDQCVMCTLQDASFLGYNCVLLSDCCGTSSPDYCVQATLFNVKLVFGFVTDTERLFHSLLSLGQE